ncbi:CBS domain-containing protein CBSX2, chloroplastic-like isoform X2 [Cornus florida]|uniref:CBS domain-containing protein CBSX2, chloroplastic-like isoform X2 n=1 Tax=Cornus florida TaxID=4283 RepID=UPI0028A1027F|nr:CBS domain-containing protein CBSX2, chloroplastic-like isoform X2 [Cornus florida]
MDSIRFADSQMVAPLPGAAVSAVHHHHLLCTLSYRSPHRPCLPLSHSSSLPRRRLQFGVQPRRPPSAVGITNSSPSRDGTYTVGDFMTRKENLQVVKPMTTVDEALETLVEKRITGFPVIDDDWKLVGVVSDYDLLALDSISGAVGSQADANLFPNVDSSWKVSGTKPGKAGTKPGKGRNYAGKCPELRRRKAGTTRGNGRNNAGKSRNYAEKGM